MGANNKFGEVKEIKRGPVIVSGYWTNESSDKITGAEMCARDEKDVVVKIGDKVKFHITVRNIDAGEIVELSLFEKKSGKDKDMSKKYDCTIDGDGHGEIEIQIDETWNKYYDEETKNNELQVYFKEKYEKKKKSLSTLEVFETKLLTVLIELKQEIGGEKTNVGHTGIIINDDFYDYGPGGEAKLKMFFAEGVKWWDSRDLERLDIEAILKSDTERSGWGITSRVVLIDIDVSKKENDKVQKWWENKYKNMGHYSILPFLGSQCTTTVRQSIESGTRVFGRSITKFTQSPNGFKDLLLKKGKHTSGIKKGTKLTIIDDYPEISVTKP